MKQLSLIVTFKYHKKKNTKILQEPSCIIKCKIRAGTKNFSLCYKFKLPNSQRSLMHFFFKPLALSFSDLSTNKNR